MQALRKGISASGSLAIALNGVIGAGIFALPSQLSAGVGAYSPYVFLMSGLLMVFIAHSIGRVARLRPLTGGPVAYAGEAFGPFIGFVTGWLAFLGSTAALAANSNVLVTYFGALSPNFDHGLIRVLLILAIWFFFTGVNIAGVRVGVWTLDVFTVLKLTPLLLVLGMGIASTRNLSPIFNPPLPDRSQLTSAILLTLYAFTGFEQALVPAGETQDAKKNIPKAILFTTISSAVLYTLIQAVCVVHLPLLSRSRAPLADLAHVFFGGFGTRLLVLTATLSIAGNLSSGFLTNPRYTFSMAERGYLPAVLSRIHERFRSPWMAILLSGILISVLAMSGTFVLLAKISVAAKFLVYAISIASLGTFSGRRALLGAPALSLVLCAALIAQTSETGWLTLAGFVAGGSLLFLLNLRSTGRMERVLRRSPLARP